ncbi:MAG: acetyltransferase [Gammaproteobacteria bacterium]|nr:acetyltransferase [Gammaproteobacteria bacterium]
MSKGLIIVGAGGHGKVVLDAALLMNKWQQIIFVDKNPEIRTLFNFQVVNRITDIPDSQEWDIIVALGNNQLRLSQSQQLLDTKHNLVTIIHPAAAISRYSKISPGTVVFSNAVINAGVSLGISCIVNTAATVDHDCQIADGVHISPGANLAGFVSVNKCSWIGIGASIIQMVSIGQNSIVGAGAVVLKNIPDNVKVVGVPAKVLMMD